MALLLEDLSDHLPTLTLLKQTKVTNKEHLYFETQNLNDKKLATVKGMLYDVDWMKLLCAKSCSENFNIFCKNVKDTLDFVAPIKEVRISPKRRYTEPSMTKGLETTSRRKVELYEKSLSKNSDATDKLLYDEYRNKYNSLKCKLMQKLLC